MLHNGEAELSLEIASYTPPGWRRRLLGQISLHVTPGTLTSIVGPSGTGKSTLLKLLIGRARGKFDGVIRYSIGGDALTPAAAASRGLVGVLSQEASLLPWATVWENLQLPRALNTTLQRIERQDAESLLGALK